MPWIDDLPAEIADSLSDEVKTNPTLIQYNSLEDALKGHIHTKSLVGSSIRIPGEEAGETDKQEFYDKLLNNAPNLMLKPDFAEPDQTNEFYRTIGKPEGADKYAMPDGNTLDAGVEAEIREIAFNSNLTQAQFSTLAKEMDSRNTTAVENLQGQADTAMQACFEDGHFDPAVEDRIAVVERRVDRVLRTPALPTLKRNAIQDPFDPRPVCCGSSSFCGEDLASPLVRTVEVGEHRVEGLGLSPCIFRCGAQDVVGTKRAGGDQ